jgi:hypothetical protein
MRNEQSECSRVVCVVRIESGNRGSKSLLMYHVLKTKKLTVRLDNGGAYLRSRVDAKFEFAFLSIVDGEAFHE